MKWSTPVMSSRAARTAVTYIAPYTRDTQRASMSAIMATAATMDATAIIVSAPPANGTAR